MFLHRAIQEIRTPYFYIRIVGSTSNYSYVEICDDKDFEIRIMYVGGKQRKDLEDIAEDKLELLEKQVVRFIEGQISYPSLIYTLSRILEFPEANGLFKRPLDDVEWE